MKPTRRVLAVSVSLLLAGLAVVAVVVLTQSGSDNTPLARAEAYERAVFSGDCAGIKEVVVAPAQIDCVAVSEGAHVYDGIDVDSATYELADSAADSATVRFHVGGETGGLNLVKVSGQWLVVLDADD